jgi:non-ribosomal peptide synthetase component E (peptide arylation enzyme)
VTYKTVLIEHPAHTAALEAIDALMNAGYAPAFTMPASQHGKDAVMVYLHQVEPVKQVATAPMKTGKKVTQ